MLKRVFIIAVTIGGVGSLPLFLHLASAETHIRISPPESASLQFLTSKKTDKIEANSGFSGDLNEPILLQSQGRLPVLLYPLHSSSSDLEISAPSLKSALGELNQEEVSRLL